MPIKDDPRLARIRAVLPDDADILVHASEMAELTASNCHIENFLNQIWVIGEIDVRILQDHPELDLSVYEDYAELRNSIDQDLVNLIKNMACG